MSKRIRRIALPVLLTLALALGMTAFAGSATAGSSASASSCSSQHTAVVKAKQHVKKDKKQLKKAKRHHHHKAVKRAKKRLKRDRTRLHRAQAAYSACLNRPAPAPAPAPTPTPNPVTEQCNDAAVQLTSQDPSGQLAVGAAAFCDELGQVAGDGGGDPVALCDQLAAQDPTGQLGQLCTGLGSLPI